MFWAPWHQAEHVHLLPDVFFQFSLEEMRGMDVQNYKLGETLNAILNK